MADEQNPTLGENGYEERMRQLDRQNKGLVGDLAEKRERIRSLEDRLATVERTLTSAGEEDGETPESRVNRLAQDPDSYIGNHIQQLQEKVILPLRQEVESLKIGQRVEKGLRWVAKQEKKDYEDVEGSELEEELARVTMEMRNRGIIPTDPYEGTRQAYKILLEERREKEGREKERDSKIEENRTASVTPSPRTGLHRWTREEINSLTADEFTANESEIRRQVADGLLK